MKTVTTIALLFFTYNLLTQDSMTAKNLSFSVKGCPFPIAYGILFGYGAVAGVEAKFNNRHSLFVGGKYITYADAGEFMGASHKLGLFEYKYYPKSSKFYLSPYVKLRELSYWEREPGFVTKTYSENALGLGFSCGEVYHLGKKQRFEANPFIGIGYFFRFNEFGGLKISGSKRKSFEASAIYRSLDLRIGVLFGYRVIR